jgi:hypothetical protein
MVELSIRRDAQFKTGELRCVEVNRDDARRTTAQ